MDIIINRLGPSYEGLELGVGDNLLMKVVAQATGEYAGGAVVVER